MARLLDLAGLGRTAYLNSQSCLNACVPHLLLRLFVCCVYFGRPFETAKITFLRRDGFGGSHRMARGGIRPLVIYVSVVSSPFR